MPLICDTVLGFFIHSEITNFHLLFDGFNAFTRITHTKNHFFILSFWEFPCENIYPYQVFPPICTEV